MNLTTGNEKKKILLFIYPIFIGGILQQLFNIFDSIIVGRVVGVIGLAAVGVSYPVMTLQAAILIGLGSGTEILIAQAIGKKEYKELQSIVDTLLSSILVLSLICSILGYIFTPSILNALKTPAESLDSSIAYLRIIFLGMVFVAGYNTLNGIIRGTGNSKVPLFFLILSAVLNIFLDILFVVVFSFGIEGAALATIISQGVSFILCVIYINNAEINVNYKLKSLKISKRIFKEGIRLSVPAAINQGSMSFAMLLLQSIVNPFGAIAVAGFTAGMRLDSFASLLILNLGMGINTFTGQNYGANKIKRIIRGKKFALEIGISVGCLIMLGAFVFGDNLASLFTSNEEVIKIASNYFRILSLGYFAAAYFTVNHGVIRGTGNTFVPMVITIVGQYIIRLPLAVILSKSIGINGIWMSISIGWFVSAIITMIYLKSKFEIYKNI